MVFGPLRDLVSRHTDIARPLRAAEVLNTDEWSATGPSFVQVLVGGDSRRAIYRDGPQPAVGDLLSCVRMSADAASLYLCLPLPFQVGCPGILYVSARRLSDDTWHIIRCDLAVGNVWQYVGPSPVSGDYARRPLHSTRGSRLFAWGSAADLSTPGPLYYSDDHAATWTACGIDVTNVAALPHLALLFACGGPDVYVSEDRGATWAAVSVPGGAGTCYDVSQGQGFANSTVALLAAGGAYWGQPFASDIDPWYGPFTPGGPGWVDAGNFGGSYFTGGTTYSFFNNFPDASTAIGALPGGDDSPGRVMEDGETWHAATGAGGLYEAADSGDPYTTPRYVPGTDGPAAGALDFRIVTDADGTVALGLSAAYTVWCGVLALDTATAPRFLARDMDTMTSAGSWQAIDGRLVADLGAEYVASNKGLTSLDWWGYDEYDIGEPPTVAVASAPGSAKANTTAPGGWELPAFDDSAWLATVIGMGFSGIDGAELVQADAGSSPTAYFRQPFTLAADVTSATLHLAANNAGVSPIYVNGTAFYTGAPMFTTYDLDISSAIIPGTTNLLAFGASAAVLGGTFTAVAYSVEATV